MTKIKFTTKGIPGFKAPGEFSRDAVREILTNPYYYGVVAEYPKQPFYTGDGKPPPAPEANRREPENLYDGQHTPLINPPLWHTVQRLRKARGNSPANRSNQKQIYPLSGVGKCYECFQAGRMGVSLRGSTGGSNRYTFYRCSAVQDKFRTPKHVKNALMHADLDLLALPDTPAQDEIQRLIDAHHTLNPKVMEADVKALLAGVHIPVAWLARVAAYYFYEDGLLAIEGKRYNIAKKFQRTQQLFAQGLLEDAEFMKANQQYQSTMQALDPIKSPRWQQLAPLVQDLAALWEQLQAREKRLLLDTLFTGLYFDGESRLRYVQPRRAFAPLFDCPPQGLFLTV